MAKKIYKKKDTMNYLDAQNATTHSENTARPYNLTLGNEQIV